MRNSKQPFLRMLNLRNFCIAAILAIFLVLAGNRTAFSANVSANFEITDAKLYQGNRELSIENGVSGSFRAYIEWRYKSETPISDGDTVSFAFGTQDFNKNGTYFHVRNSKDLPIIDANGSTLGYWNINGRKMNIRFTDAAVGHYILEGSITTSTELMASDSMASDKVVYFPIADKRVAFTRKASKFSPLTDGYYYSNLATNGTLYWDYCTPGITANEFYKGNGRVAFTDKAKLSNLSYETTLSSLAIDASINIYALAQLPLNVDDVTAGAAGAAFWINATKLFKRVYQTEGQTYDEYFAALNDGEYGVYREQDGSLRVAVKFGSQPSNITYSQAMTASGRSGKRVGEGYISMPEAKDALNLLDDPNTVSEGKVLRFVAEIAEQIPTTSGGVRASNTAKNAYSEEDGEDVDSGKNTTVTIPVGSASAVIIGEARLRLVDAESGKPLAGRTFILQEQTDDGWQDLDNTLRVTDADGRIQILNLIPGKNYRWQQIDFAEHYDTNSFKVEPEQTATTKSIRNVKDTTSSTASFTMPTNSGINFLATNSLQTYKITYELGDGSDSDDIVYEQGYGDTTKQPDMNAIELRDGYEFIGWSRDIAETVTEDATYVAKWSYVSSTKSITTATPEPVAKTADDVEPPLTYDAFTRYVAILASSLTLSLYFAPSALRAYRVHRYRK